MLRATKKMRSVKAENRCKPLVGNVSEAQGRRGQPPGASLAFLTKTSVFGLVLLNSIMVRAETVPMAQAQLAFAERQAVYQKEPQSAEAAWRFACACFDLAEFSTNRAQRAELAGKGITACRESLSQNTNCAQLHYYLGLNLGQLARTKTLGALKLVNEMEREFLLASQLDPNFDYAGAERSLGLLYRDAPALGSIGSRVKSRQHFLRALDLAPDYPENRLNLLESELKWNERIEARAQVKLFEDGLPKARALFGGPTWSADWADWDNRLAAARKKLEEPARLAPPRH